MVIFFWFFHTIWICNANLIGDMSVIGQAKNQSLLLYENFAINGSGQIINSPVLIIKQFKGSPVFNMTHELKPRDWQMISSVQDKSKREQQKHTTLMKTGQEKDRLRQISNQRIYLISIFILMLIFGFLVYYDIRSKTKANKKLAAVNRELESQRDKLTQALGDLSENELKYKNLVQNSPTGILLIDRSGEILEVNQTMLKILGSPGEEQTKKINCLAYPPLKEVGMADDIISCIKTGQTIRKEYDYTSKWGKAVYLSIYITPLLTVSGQVSSLIINAEDITISRKAEKLIQKSEEKYRMLVENSLQAMMIIQKGKIIFANSKLEELTQYDVEYLSNQGRQWLKLIVHPDDLRQSMRNIKDALDGKAVSSKNEYRIIRKDGKIRWIETLSSVVDYQDQPSMMVVAIDITDRKEAETFLISSGEKLRQANAMKDKFFSIVAHDLKNPFNAILGFSNLLYEAYDDFDQIQRKAFIKNICEASENTFKLLQNLLDWSRTQTGNIECRPVTIDLSVIANENMAIMQASATRKKVKISMKIPYNTTAYADENMVKTVMRNLISNAVKFTRREGQIDIISEELEEEVVVCIQDSGVGIDPENLTRLFRIDEQIKTKGTDNETGSGLGLILCKELVEKNNGKIWAESKPGEGSRFCFTLPVAK
ncbi:MAG: PAS domain-containing sensor histidine kinase [Bacteroidetes bacterium]|nr:PAS domain-containing sensor histidine kinase [Bacteroidota bacterium]